MDLHTDPSRLELVALVSAVVTGLAAFLPWATGVAAGPVSVETTRSGIDGLGVLTLLVAAVVIAAILVYGTDELAQRITMLGGLIVVVVGLWTILTLGDPVAPGIGLYLTILGGFGTVAGGALAYRDHTGDSPTEAFT